MKRDRDAATLSNPAALSFNVTGFYQNGMGEHPLDAVRSITTASFHFTHLVKGAGSFSPSRAALFKAHLL